MLDLSRITQQENSRNKELEESIDRKLANGHYKNVAVNHTITSKEMTEEDYKKYGMPNPNIKKKKSSSIDNGEIMKTFEDLLR